MPAGVSTSMAPWRPRVCCSGPRASTVFPLTRSKPRRSPFKGHRFNSFRNSASERASAQTKRERPIRNAIENAKEREEVRGLVSRTVYRRAVDAVIWGLPLVGEDAVKQAAFREGNANYNDIVWWPKGVYFE